MWAGTVSPHLHRCLPDPVGVVLDVPVDRAELVGAGLDGPARPDLLADTPALDLTPLDGSAVVMASGPAAFDAPPVAWIVPLLGPQTSPGEISPWSLGA